MGEILGVEMRAAAKCPLKLGVAPARRQFYQQVGQLFLPNVWVVGIGAGGCSFKTKHFNKSNYDDMINTYRFYLLLSPLLPLFYPSWRGYVGAIYIFCIFV